MGTKGSKAFALINPSQKKSQKHIPQRRSGKQEDLLALQISST